MPRSGGCTGQTPPKDPVKPLRKCSRLTATLACRPALASTSRWAGAALVAVALPTVALAGPLVTEDAGAIDSGRCEWESHVARYSADGVVERAAATQLSCGLGWLGQLGVSASRVRGPEGARDDILGLAGKRALSHADGRWPVALAYAVDAIQSGGGSGYSLRDMALNAVASPALSESTTLHLNLGWSREHPARQTATNWNLALESSLAHGWAAMAELYGCVPWAGLARAGPALVANRPFRRERVHCETGWLRRQPLDPRVQALAFDCTARVVRVARSGVQVDPTR